MARLMGLCAMATGQLVHDKLRQPAGHRAVAGEVVADRAWGQVAEFSGLSLGYSAERQELLEFVSLFF